MGYRCRWLATKGQDRASVLKRLGLTVAREWTEAVHDTGLYAVEIGEWLVVIGDGWDHMDTVQRREALRLSDRGEVLFLYTDDTPMDAEIVCFAERLEVWSMTYASGNEPELAGKVPAAARKLLDAARRQQEKDVDYVYGVIAELGETLTGFRHDRTLGDGEHLPIYELAKV